MKKIILLLLLFSLTQCGKGNKTTEEYLASGQKAFTAGDFKTARTEFLKGLASSPSDHDLNYYTGLAYQRDYMYDSALFYLKKADLLYPNEREINLAIYQVAPKFEDWENQIKAIKVLILTGDSEDKYNQELGELYHELNNIHYSLFYYKKLLSAEPENPQRYLEVSNLATMVESLTLAQDVLDKGVEKFGLLDEFKANQGTLHSIRKEFDEAEKIFRSLLTKDTANIFLKINLASTLSEQENRDKKHEAYLLLKEIRQITSRFEIVDSLLINLREELNITE
jgi:tetratricopeptide (TPR) repeat protein